MRKNLQTGERSQKSPARLNFVCYKFDKPFANLALFFVFNKFNLTDSRSKKKAALVNQGNQGGEETFGYSINVRKRKLKFLSYLHTLQQINIRHNLRYLTVLLYSSFNNSVFEHHNYKTAWYYQKSSDSDLNKHQMV